jgi:hypothetical protein
MMSRAKRKRKSTAAQPRKAQATPWRTPASPPKAPVEENGEGRARRDGSWWPMLGSAALILFLLALIAIAYITRGSTPSSPMTPQLTRPPVSSAAP